MLSLVAHTLSKLIQSRKLYLCSIMLVLGLNSATYASDDSFRDQLKVWDRDDIHSIHKKLYTKEGRHELTLPLGAILNNEGYGLAGLQYTYHIFENFGIEAVNGLFGFQFGDDDKLFAYQASVTFSPLYGKISFFTWLVANFDIYMLAGAGVVKYSGRFN
jgi:hypothetical protein